MLFFFAAASFAAWLLLFAGIATRRDVRRRNDEEYTRTTGVIVDYVRGEFRTGKSGRNTYWKPVVEFEAEGQKYRLEYENGMDRDRFPVGMAVDILYAVSDPSRFHLADDPVFLDPGGGAIRISIIWIVVSAALAIALAVFVGGARPDLHRLWHVFQGVVRSR